MHRARATALRLTALGLTVLGLTALRPAVLKPTTLRIKAPKAFALALAAIGLMAASLPTTACTLTGHWRVDKTKTLAGLYGSRVSNAEKMKLARQYRDATIDYSGCNKMHTRRGRFEEIRHFDIVEDTREYVIIRFKDNDDMALLTREGKCYKTPVQGKAYYEHYCKN